MYPPYLVVIKVGSAKILFSEPFQSYGGKTIIFWCSFLLDTSQVSVSYSAGVIILFENLHTAR